MNFFVIKNGTQDKFNEWKSWKLLVNHAPKKEPADLIFDHYKFVDINKFPLFENQMNHRAGLEN